MSKDTKTELSRRDFEKLIGVSGAAILGSVSLAGCAGQGGTAYACPYCDKTFEAEGGLKDHLVANHAEEFRAALGAEEGAIACPYGDQEFESLEKLRSHIKTEHLDAVTLPEWDREEDVVIVGSGFAGLAAGIEAKEAGVSVAVLEKMSRPGGNSRINGGVMSVVGSDRQKKQGIEDSVDLFMEDLLEAGRGLNHPELIEFLGEHTLDTYRWTIDHLGVEWSDQINHLGGHSVPRSAKTQEGSGWGVVRKELEKLNDLGVEVETNTMLEEIIKDQDGEVVGVQVREGYEHGEENSGEVTYIKAKKGVVLATGGFGRDQEFRMDQWPSLDEEMDTTNHAGATSEGLKEAIRKGADPVHLSWIQLGPWPSPEEKGMGQGTFFAAGVACPYGMWIDPETGKRFVDELEDRRTRAQAELAVGKEPEYPLAIADSTAASRRSELVSTLVERGVVYEFDSLKKLASHFGVPYDALSEQVETYNGYVEEGEDKQFGKPLADDAKPLTTAPWYAMRLWPKIHHTMGGVEITTETEVCTDGEKIPNLYAAGEVVGGIHGGCRLGSVATADCLVYGRLAGANAAGASNPYK